MDYQEKIKFKDMFKNIRRERFLASYNYIDLARGKAIQAFYGAKGITAYHLSEVELYSNDIQTYHTAGNYVLTKILDLDFDVVFDVPRTIDGLANVNATMGITKIAVWVPATASTYIIAKIRKYSGVTETDLVTATSSTHAVSGESGTTSLVLNIDANIPSTHFKIGDTLRLTIEQWAVTTGTGNYSIGFGHDPKGRDGSVIIGAGNPTTLDFFVPFKIEV